MIPEQLKDMSFCRVRKGTKEPFEKEWQNKPYNYKDIQQYIPKDDYGVLCGINELGIIDDDTSDKRLLKLLIDKFGRSFRVRSHYYCKLKGWDGSKKVLYDTDGTHLGELQGIGSQAVGAGSLHPSGEIYAVVDNLDIIEIDFNQFLEIMSKYIIKKESMAKELKKISWSGDKIQDIPISNIISFTGRNMGHGCYQGSHPIHGSTTGMNFRINTNKNIWYCFRCGSGGGASELIAVVENIILCSQAGANCFTEEQGKELIKIARDKYGLQDPTLSYEPKGWANSIKISKLAERHNFKICSKCSKSFNFNDRLGWWNCSCSKGNLKDFAELILKGANNGK